MLNLTTDLEARQGLSKTLPYEAFVVDNDDPLGLCRVRARIPVLFSGIPDEHLPWAIPEFAHMDGAGPGSGTAYVPKKGTKVLLHFIDGKETSPKWSGYPVDKTTVLEEMRHNYPDRKVMRLQNKALIVIDTKSNEIFLRSPGDVKIYVEGNVEMTVQGDLTEIIKGNRKLFVEGDNTEVVKGNKKEDVKGNKETSTGGTGTSLTKGAANEGFLGVRSVSVGGSNSLSVAGSDSYQVAGSHTRNASVINDNSGGPSVTSPVSVSDGPETPDLENWTGVPGGAPGAFLKGFSPFAEPVDAATSLGEDGDAMTPEMQEAYKKAGIDLNQPPTNPAPSDTDNAEPTPATALPESCAAFADKTSFPPTMQLTANFTLGDLSTKALLERSAVVAQAGLTAAQIVCNLKTLAENMLEPLLAQYGRPNINCGFRPANAGYGSPTGWHIKGCAADLQWAGISDREYYERAVWIKNNLPFCEVILEYGGNRPWIHVAFNTASKNTTNFKTRVGVPSRYMPGILALKNIPGVGAA